MSDKIVIVDYGMGNIHSVVKKIQCLNADINVSVTSNINKILKSDKIVLVGVGHFKKAMENLQKLRLIDVLNEAVLFHKKPILGICLGMQLMSNKSEEGGVSGLGWIDSKVKKLKVEDSVKYKIPHMGWNSITIKRESLLMRGLNSDSEFYFSHSYYMDVLDMDVVLSETKYSSKFSSSIEQENIFGVQFHPEKSHESGDILLSNFIRI